MTFFAERFAARFDPESESIAAEVFEAVAVRYPQIRRTGRVPGWMVDAELDRLATELGCGSVVELEAVIAAQPAEDARLPAEEPPVRTATPDPPRSATMVVTVGGVDLPAAPSVRPVQPPEPAQAAPVPPAPARGPVASALQLPGVPAEHPWHGRPDPALAWPVFDSDPRWGDGPLFTPPKGPKERRGTWDTSEA